jgi:hypothetical protein
MGAQVNKFIKNYDENDSTVKIGCTLLNRFALG